MSSVPKPRLRLLAALHLISFAVASSGCSLVYKHREERKAFSIYSNRDAEYLADVAERLERIYAGLREVFQVPEARLGRPAVVLEGEDSAVVDLRSSPDVLGYYLPVFNLISIDAWPASRNGETLDQVLLHEAAHHFITSKWPAANSECWLNEGLAGALEVSPFSSTAFEAPLLNPVLLCVAQRAVFDPEESPDLDEILDMGWGRFHDDAIKERNYALAWSLVYFLLERHLPASEPLPERLQKLWELDRSQIAKLEAQWRCFLRGFDVTSELLELAARRDRGSSLTALWAIRQLGETPAGDDIKALGGLVSLFGDGDGRKRDAARLAFVSRLGRVSHSFVLTDPVVQAGVARVQAASMDPGCSSELRAALAEAFGSSSHVPEGWIALLVALLEDRDGRTRAAAAGALSRLTTHPTIVNPEFWRGAKEADRAREVAEWRAWLSSSRQALSTFR